MMRPLSLYGTLFKTKPRIDGWVDYDIDNTIDWGNGTEQTIPEYNYTQVSKSSF